MSNDDRQTQNAVQETQISLIEYFLDKLLSFVFDRIRVDKPNDKQYESWKDVPP